MQLDKVLIGSFQGFNEESGKIQMLLDNCKNLISWKNLILFFESDLYVKKSQAILHVSDSFGTSNDFWWLGFFWLEIRKAIDGQGWKDKILHKRPFFYLIPIQRWLLFWSQITSHFNNHNSLLGAVYKPRRQNLGHFDPPPHPL